MLADRELGEDYTYLYAWPVDRKLLSAPCCCWQIIQDLLHSLLKVRLLLSRLIIGSCSWSLNQTLFLLRIMIYFLNRCIIVPFWQSFETADIFAFCELLLVQSLHLFTSLDYRLKHWLRFACLINYHSVRVVPWKHDAFFVYRHCRRYKNLFTLVSFHLPWVFHRTLSFHQMGWHFFI